MVASIVTYLQYSQNIAERATASRAIAAPVSRQEGGGERRTARPGPGPTWDGAQSSPTTGASKASG